MCLCMCALLCKIVATTLRKANRQTANKMRHRKEIYVTAEAVYA